MNQTPLLDEQGTAEWLGVSRRTLQGWRFRTGEGPPFIKLGPNGRIRYSIQSLNEWLAKNTCRSTSDRVGSE